MTRTASAGVPEHATPREALLAAAVAWFAAHGVGDSSLRTIAAGVGTSHRMLIYHFGSREGLLAAVVEAVEQGERRVLADLLASHADPFEAGAAFWHHVADAAQVFGPLFFELSSWAMRGLPAAEPLRQWLRSGWLTELSEGFRRAGVPDDAAGEWALRSLAMSRGLLFELCATGNRPAVDAAMAGWTELVRSQLAPPPLLTRPGPSDRRRG